MAWEEFQVLFKGARDVAGRFHRRRSALSKDQQEAERGLTPLSAPWNNDSRWYPADISPRAHNHIVPLIHGETYFTDLLESLANATTRVTIIGWAITPLMLLRRGEGELDWALVDVLNKVSLQAEVLVLLWSGGAIGFKPDTRDMKAAQTLMGARAPRVRCVLDTRSHFSHDHHQKAISVDGTVAYVGGMDLSTYQGDRWDTVHHPLRYGPNWHDIQLRLEGEIVADVEQNFVQRWNAVTGEHLQVLPTPPPDPTWDTPAQLVRTVPAKVYPFAEDGIFGIRHALLAAIARAEHFIYLENQYFWAPEIVDALTAAMTKPRSGPFRIVLVLPARAYTGRYDNDHHVEMLRKADGGAGRFETYSLWTGGAAASASGFHYEAIYVHAKVSIVDDVWFSVGSANLNRRGLATDTEINVHSPAPHLARALRVALWAEHLGCSEAEVEAHDPIDMIDGAWKDVAATMRAARDARVPQPRGQVIRYEPGRGPRSQLLDYAQDVTLER